LELQSAVADINNSVFRNGGAHGLSTTYATALTLRNSKFQDNNLSAVLIAFGTPKFDPVLSNLTATGNKQFNAVVYKSVSIDKPHTFEKMGLPYVFKGGFDVDPSGSATFAPGIEVRVDTGFYVDGIMTAVGTPTEPILFTGIKQQPGGWWGINISGGQLGMAGLRLDHAIVEYGGSDNSDYGGNLIVSTANVTVTNTTLRNSSTYGVYNEGGAPDEQFAVSISNSTITGNAKGAVVCTDESCNMSLNNLSVTGNGQDGIIYRSYVFGSNIWRNMGLPYIIEGQGGVGDDSTLTIEPGVEVRMAQESSFSVNGVLSAVGTAQQPVIFTGTTKQAGWWQGIRIDNGGVAELRFCDVGYGGNWGAVDNSAMLMTQSSSLVLANCRIHDSSSAGIMVVAGAKPNIRNNRIENNLIGLNAVFPLEQVDARFNWWGHASGPKHDSNPNGQGQQIIGNVAFAPWLTSPDETGGGNIGITVDLSGPGRYAPGDTIVYSVFYHNGTGKAIDNAVLRFGMPANAVLLDASGGSVFHIERNHVFWKLGNLAPGGQGLVWVRVQYDWGLPNGMKTATAAQLSGANLPAPVFNVNDYLAYTPRTLQTLTDLTQAQVDQLRGASPELQKLYQQALAGGFQFALAEQHTYSTGQQEVEIRMLRFNPQMSLLSLWLANGNVVGTLVDASSYTVIRDGQAARYDLQTNAWSPVTVNPIQAAATNDGISWSECVTNCIEDKLPGYILKKKIKSISELSKMSNCAKSAAGDEEGYLGCAKWIGKKIPFIGEGIDLGECNGECQLCEESGGSCDNPNCHCCTEDKYRCDSGDWLYGSFGIDVIKMKKCSLDEGDDMGTYLAETVIKVCALCEKCMDSGSPVCVAKTSSNMTLNSMATLLTLAAQQGAQDNLEVAANSDQECDECRQAKDPNEMYGPSGDLLPGQLVTYEVAYENIGEGTAFGVFIMNKLPEGVFDLATLQINNGGSYSAGSQSISWDVGDLAPKGQAGASGKVSYSVRLRADLPSGTVIANSAVVHFPSVPEETPTNRVVNLIQPLVADPQARQTEVGVPLPIKLSGRDAVGTPLTFQIVEGPAYGTLSGAAPNLTYTPDAGVGGLDRIRFTVNNGVATSKPADVAIRVLPSSRDVTGPAVQWTAPKAQAQVVLAAAVAGTDNTGSYYYPAVQAQFNEPLNPATVNGQTVMVKDAAGKVIKADVRYDASIDQMQLLLREEPKAGMRYTVTVTTGVKDLRGNAMSAAYAWSFTVAGFRQPAELPNIYLPVIKR
jgi:parallel beta-helix repeat protein